MSTTFEADTQFERDITTDRVLMISSDGHATARMPDYRPYLPAALREEFDEFCKLYAVEGARLNEEASMVKSFDQEFIDMWKRNVLEVDRLEGTWDVAARMGEMERGGLAAEVIFPDFGIPFELYNKTVAALKNYRRTPEQIRGAYSAYNRWLVDFCSSAPHRFAGMALVSFDNVEDAMTEIRWAKANGFKGILLPTFSSRRPLFHPDFEPIWSLAEELEMPVNSHTAQSGTFEFGILPSNDDEYLPEPPPLPDTSVVGPIIQKPVFYSIHQMLMHFVWGGVLERHPNMQVVFTEAGSAWVVGMLANMDYTWDGAFTPRAVREHVKIRPSEYFRRQCHLGSSVFSLAEMEHRHEIGLDKITLGMDFPHPEGTWGMGPGHIEYLRATIGAAHVPADEARLLIGENAVDLWGFDRQKLQPIVDATGPVMEDILQEPAADYFPRGDVHKPFGDPR
jgi:predicted TIM-barrel fold metal-dependent hydrolase